MIIMIFFCYFHLLLNKFIIQLYMPVPFSPRSQKNQHLLNAEQPHMWAQESHLSLGLSLQSQSKLCCQSPMLSLAPSSWPCAVALPSVPSWVLPLDIVYPLAMSSTVDGPCYYHMTIPILFCAVGLQNMKKDMICTKYGLGPWLSRVS